MGSWTELPFPSSALRFGLALCALLAVDLVLSAAQVRAAEAAGPVIESTSVTNLTEHGATLQARIDPQGLETEYEFRLVWQDPDAHPTVGERPTGGVQAHTGSITAGPGPQTVSFEVTNLRPGNAYWYEVGAINSAGHTDGFSPYLFGFYSRGEYPEGESNPPYEGEMPLFERWYLKLSEEESHKTLMEYEAKQKQKAKEQEEQKAQEAAAALKNREEEEATKATDSGSLSLAATSVIVQKDGMALVKFDCTGVTSCRGKLTLTATRMVKVKGKERARTIPIGTVSFSIHGDQTKTVRVKIEAAGRKLLKADGGRLRASLAILELAPNRTNTHTRVRLVQHKARR